MITAVNGEQIDSNADLPRIISLLDPGDKVTLDIIRDGEAQQLDRHPGRAPEHGPALTAAPGASGSARA